MSLLRKKILLLGLYGSGKTSVFRRYVDGVFSEEYMSTLGVNIKNKNCNLSHANVELLIWDVADTDEFYSMQNQYYKGTSGVFVVLDATRIESIERFGVYHAAVQKSCGNIPIVGLLNKSDLDPTTGLNECLAKIPESIQVIKTSAKTGENIENAFETLASCMTINNKSNLSNEQRIGQ